jgi:hypothetical protein
MNEYMARKCNGWQQCRDYAKQRVSLDRAAYKLMPISVSAFADNRQLTLRQGYLMPASQLAVTEKAINNPSFQTWGIFDSPVF